MTRKQKRPPCRVVEIEEKPDTTTTTAHGPDADAAEILTPDAREWMRAEIAAARGVEVFFVGKRNSEGIIDRVQAWAWGRAHAVPILMSAARPGDVVIHNHPSGELEPSPSDLEVGSVLGNAGVSCLIVSNDVERVRRVVECRRPVVWSQSPMAAEVGEIGEPRRDPGRWAHEIVENLEWIAEQPGRIRYRQIARRMCADADELRSAIAPGVEDQDIIDACDAITAAVRDNPPDAGTRCREALLVIAEGWNIEPKWAEPDFGRGAR